MSRVDEVMAELEIKAAKRPEKARLYEIAGMLYKAKVGRSNHLKGCVVCINHAINSESDNLGGSKCEKGREAQQWIDAAEAAKLLLTLGDHG